MIFDRDATVARDLVISSHLLKRSSGNWPAGRNGSVPIILFVLSGNASFPPLRRCCSLHNGDQILQLFSLAPYPLRTVFARCLWRRNCTRWPWGSLR
jgi:hypothetical protein